MTGHALGRAEAWRSRGSYFRWRPPDEPQAQAVDVFHVESGPPDAPVLLLVHGFPTSSVDWFEFVDLLGGRYRACALDFPGYGYSDKPLGWGYSLGRDAQLLDFYVREVLAADSVAILAHDRGSSVALNYALVARDGPKPVSHLVLSNGNIFLPLSNLTQFQRLLVSGSTAPDVLQAVTPELLAAGMGSTTFSPPRPPDHPDVQALAATFAHADGVKVLHETIQYLVERAEHERGWLELLASVDIRTTVIWGLLDTVSPPRVAMHVWSNFLMLKPGDNRFYFVPEANHYLQVDRPDAVIAALLHAESQGAPLTPGPISADPGAPVLVDCSRAGLPPAQAVLSVGPS